MKQFLQSTKVLLIVLLSVFTNKAFAQSETLDCPEGTIVGTTMTFNTDNFTIVHAKGTDSNFAVYSPWRVYTNNTVTFTGGGNVQKINSIVITAETTAYATAAANTAGLSVVSGTGSATVSSSGTTATITVTGTSVNSVRLKPSAQTRWSKIVINYTSAGKTVTFNANTGTGTMAPQSSGVPVDLTLNAFLKTGYTFQNWHTVMSGTGGTSYTNGQQYDFSADMTLYAQWQINQYNVSYNANGSTSGAVPVTQSANYNSNITLDNNSGVLARTGYTFNGWNTNAAGGVATHYNAGASFTIPANNVTMFAEWVSNAPSLTTTGTITAMSTTYGTASIERDFTINGVNLTGTNVTVTPPAGFELSTTSGGTYTSTLSLPITAGSVSSPVYVRLASTTNAGNYNGNITLTDGTTSVTTAIPNSTVSPKVLMINGITAASKTYDATTSATLVGAGSLVGIVNGDAVTLSGSGTGTFANKNVNTGIAVSITGYTLSGAKAGNYALVQPTATADITKASITISAPTIAPKAYNTSTTTGTITIGTVFGTVGGETLTVTPTGTFSDANVGTAKPATVSYTVTDGTGLAANYTGLANSSATGDITATAPTITPTAMNLNVNATANITSNSTGTITYTSANPAIASVNASGVVTGLAIGTTTINVSQVANGNYTAGTGVVTVTVTDVTTGTYRTTGAGSWPGGASAATWERMTAGGWTTATPAASATDLLIIRHAVTSGAAIAASGGTKMQIDDQGSMSITHSSTFASMVIKKGGTLDVAGTAVGFNTSGATLDVEDGGKVIISAAITNTSTFWRAKENFAKGSTVEVSNYSGAFFANPPQIDTNADGYYFGNLTFSGSLTSLSVIGTNSVTDFNLTEGDLTVNGTSNNILLVTPANKNVTINGSVNVNAGQLRGFAATSNSTSTLTINKDVNVNAGVFNFAPGISGTVVSYLKLKGNLTTAAGTTLQSSDSDSDIYFIGNDVQYVDVAGATNIARFRVKAGASVELKNNLVLNNSSELSVEDGGTLNFGYKTSDSSPSIISNSGTGANKFALEDGGTIKVTHPKGVVKNIANDGNVQLAVSNKTFSSNATYHYIGKVNQEMGDALNSSSTKNVFVELANNALTISPSASFGITNTGILDIRAGKLIENDVNYITGGSSSTNGGTLKMAAGTQYYITKASASTADSEYIPRFYNTNLLGGEIVLASTGNQTLRGGQTYKDLTFSNGGEKTVSTATAAIDNILIKDNTVVNPGSSVFGGISTTLTMQNTALLKLSGSGTKPDMTGVYTLAPTTKIEFAGSALKTIRLSPTYANVTVSGDNVSVNSTTGGLTLQVGTNFQVTDTGVFRLQNVNGFSGANNTAIKNTNNPSIILEPLSIIDYGGANQVVTHATVTSPADASYQNLRVSSAGTKTATGTTVVKNKVIVTGGELLVASTANNVTPNVLEARAGIDQSGTGVLRLANNAVLMQDATAVNTGAIIAERHTQMRRLDYTYWSAPVTGQVLLNTTGTNAGNENSAGGFSPSTPNDNIYRYDEPTNKFKPTGDAQFIPAKAYAIRGKKNYGTVFTPDTFNYTGKPNVGDGIEVTVQNSPQGVGYNIVGNPYPSSLDFNAFYDANKTVINGVAWFWSNVSVNPPTQEGLAYNGNNYATLTQAGGAPPTYTWTPDRPDSSVFIPTQYIKLGQGFIVEVTNKGLGQKVVFNNNMRAVNNGTFFNDNGKVNEQRDRFWLTMTSPTSIVNTLLLAYVNGATNGNDKDYDAELLVEGSDSFYTILDNLKLQIQARQYPLVTEDVVPVGYKNYEDGVYTIALDRGEGIFAGSQPIYLRDKVAKKYVNLLEGPYSFQGSKSMTNDSRFDIIYKEDATLGTTDLSKSGVDVYKSNDSFVVKSAQKITRVELYDMAGRLLYVTDKAANEINIPHNTLSNSTYVLKISQGNKETVKKVIK